MELLNDLKMIDQYIGKDSEKFQACYASLLAKYPSDIEKKQIVEYVEKAMSDLVKEIDTSVNEIGVKVQLLKVYEMVSMSYIAKTYFNRTRQWLYKKVNGSLINGKPAKFTPEEIKQLNFAFQDMGKQLGSISISL